MTEPAPWRRLDPRMIVVHPVAAIVRLLPVFAVVLLTGRSGDPARIWFTLGAAGLIVVFGALRWRFTQYRITPDRVELHSGWLRRQHRSVPRDRIRTVDLTARLEHRVFGLTVVKVGSATTPGHGAGEGGLALDAVSRAEGERLRRDLLERPTAGPVTAAVAGGAPASGSPPAAPPAVLLATLDWGWLRFAPLTFSSLAGIGVVAGALFNVLNDLGVSPGDVGRSAVGDLSRAGIAAVVGVLGVGFLALAVAGSVVLFAERWFGYRLTREPDGTLRVHRGLLTRRSLSIAAHRLRGVEIVEPVLLRAGRGAQARALAAGLARDTQGGVLQPPVPRAEAHRVAAAVTGASPELTTHAPLRRHPPAARRRRLVRALVPAALVVVAAFVLGSPVLGEVSLVLLPVAALVGLDRARGLGHAVTPGHLVARRGGLVRRTVALQRSGVIGWTVRQSVFQRRAGVATVTAVTGAGVGGYPILDASASDVAPLIATVTGELAPLVGDYTVAGPSLIADLREPP